jgi:hypothetical protein
VKSSAAMRIVVLLAAILSSRANRNPELLKLFTT